MDTMWRLVEAEEGRRKKLQYRFFKKPGSTPLVTPMRSAQSINGKIATLSQEVFRILTNCSRDVTRDEEVELLETFTKRLQVSGYPCKVASKIVRNGTTNFLRRLERQKQGKGPLHRPEEDGRVERRLAKVVGKDRWYRRQGSSGGKDQMCGDG